MLLQTCFPHLQHPFLPFVQVQLLLRDLWLECCAMHVIQSAMPFSQATMNTATALSN